MNREVDAHDRPIGASAMAKPPNLVRVRSVGRRKRNDFDFQTAFIGEVGWGGRLSAPGEPGHVVGLPLGALDEAEELQFGDGLGETSPRFF